MCVETRHEVTWKISGIEPGPEMIFAYLTIIISKDKAGIPVVLCVPLFLMWSDSFREKVQLWVFVREFNFFGFWLWYF
jgi:hypothetical protein